MRKYPERLSASARQLVDELPSVKNVARYRAVMTELGQELALDVFPRFASVKDIVLICTNEDADFLARGLLDGLQAQGCEPALVCFWNDRVSLSVDDARAPIVRRYVEQTKPARTFLVVKSIISSSCVVRTNISELVYDLNPQDIFVLAPVILKGAQDRLESEFEPGIAARFKYAWFAEDDESKENGEVIPGVGGSVYELLGIGDSKSKNSFVPELVRERRKLLHR